MSDSVFVSAVSPRCDRRVSGAVSLSCPSALPPMLTESSRDTNSHLETQLSAFGLLGILFELIISASPRRQKTLNRCLSVITRLFCFSLHIDTPQWVFFLLHRKKRHISFPSMHFDPGHSNSMTNRSQNLNSHPVFVFLLMYSILQCS